MTKDIKKECLKRIKELIPNITGADKRLACYELDISRPTLDKYIHSTHVDDIANPDTAISIIEFFTEKITERAQRLNKVA
jgi:hypothetical protein